MEEQVIVTGHEVWTVGGMTQFFSAKWCNQVLGALSIMWLSIVVKQYVSPTEQATPFVLDCATQFIQGLTVCHSIYRFTPRQKINKQHPLPVPKHSAHDFLGWNGLLELHLFGRCWVPPFHGLLFWFRCNVRHPCLITSDDLAWKQITFLTVPHENSQHWLNVLFCATQSAFLGPSVSTTSDNLAVCHNFIENTSWKLRKFIRQWRNRKPPILTNFFVNFLHQVVINDRRSPTPCPVSYTHLEIRAVIRFLNARDVKAADIHRQISEVKWRPYKRARWGTKWATVCH